jgi:hypothetical protein
MGSNGFWAGNDIHHKPLGPAQYWQQTQETNPPAAGHGRRHSAVPPLPDPESPSVPRSRRSARRPPATSAALYPSIVYWLLSFMGRTIKKAKKAKSKTTEVPYKILLFLELPPIDAIFCSCFSMLFASLA